MIENLKDLKKQVAKDWQCAFPQLTVFAHNNFYKMVGPIIAGLELIKLPRTEEYRPHFVCYPLWKQNLDACFEFPIILKEFYNKKGLQISIPYLKHADNFSDLVIVVKEQMPIPLEGDVSLKRLFYVFDEYAKYSTLGAAPNSYLQARLQEAKLEIALILDDEYHVQTVISQIQTMNWDKAHFSLWKVDLSLWLQRLSEKINDREKLITKAEQNMQEKKLKNLHRSELQG